MGYFPVVLERGVEGGVIRVSDVGDLLELFVHLTLELEKEGRKEEKNVMIYLTTRSTYFIYGYMASDIMVKDHADSERSYH